MLRALGESDVIFAEDTRVTHKLLQHYGIATPLRSFHERTEQKRSRELRDLLRAGKTVAVTSDAGTPGISDPGIELVRGARAIGARIEVLPGPSAIPAALVLSGFDVSSFRFDGFLPRKSGERRAYLETLKGERAAVVWFESPNRVSELLRDVAATLPERRIFILREYTKKFEEHSAGTASQLLSRLPRQSLGEFTLVLEGAGKVRAAEKGSQSEVAIAYLRKAGVSARDAAEAIRLATGASRNDMYRLAIKTKRGR